MGPLEPECVRLERCADPFSLLNVPIHLNKVVGTGISDTCAAQTEEREPTPFIQLNRKICAIENSLQSHNSTDAICRSKIERSFDDSCSQASRASKTCRAGRDDSMYDTFEFKQTKLNDPKSEKDRSRLRTEFGFLRLRGVIIMCELSIISNH